MRGRLTDDGVVSFREFAADDDELAAIDEVLLLGMGTSRHAAMVGEYLDRGLGRHSGAGAGRGGVSLSPADLRAATRWRSCITQSGETADTLVGLQLAKERGALTVAVTNVFASSAARDADGAIYLHSGPEIGVASTKTFAGAPGQPLPAGLAPGDGQRAACRWSADEELVAALRELPDQVRGMLEREKEIAAIAQRYSRYRNFLYIGRGLSYPVALEGALKLKEISYVHAEGMTGGELKHGPIALLDQEFPVIAICTASSTKRKDGQQRARDRRPRRARARARSPRATGRSTASPPTCSRCRASRRPPSAILNTVVLQLFAYHVAVELGQDVDQPRNLAKSVTVE